MPQRPTCHTGAVARTGSSGASSLRNRHRRAEPNRSARTPAGLAWKAANRGCMRRPSPSILVAPLATLLVLTGFVGVPPPGAPPAHWVEQEKNGATVGVDLPCSEPPARIVATIRWSNSRAATLSDDSCT